MNLVLGCGDSACEYGPPASGMVTNGGCRCFKNLRSHQLKQLVQEREELRIALRVTLEILDTESAGLSAFAFAAIAKARTVLGESTAPVTQRLPSESS